MGKSGYGNHGKTYAPRFADNARLISQSLAQYEHVATHPDVYVEAEWWYSREELYTTEVKWLCSANDVSFFLVEDSRDAEPMEATEAWQPRVPKAKFSSRWEKWARTGSRSRTPPCLMTAVKTWVDVESKKELPQASAPRKITTSSIFDLLDSASA
ncbi:hypothetical protein B0T14DRAFT_570821 [Immersiella caudata]|uniref:Uncharacterized protein n=1 Tax=Immersiella caudata TaxID=314043 RepID=A0AA39TS49_9PEZI|nr:hypothetical protein B0T14DRAFT_570821 [Immersiella caudata]